MRSNTENGINLAPVSRSYNEAEDPNDPVRELAQALGFDVEDAQTVYSPYIAYIRGYWPGKGTKEDYLRVFAEIVGFFKDHADDLDQPTIQALIDAMISSPTHHYFGDMQPNSDVRRIVVNDTVLLVLGLFTLMRSYFVPFYGRERHILSVTRQRHRQSPNQALPDNSLAQSLPNLVRSSGLLPNSSEAVDVLPPDTSTDGGASPDPNSALTSTNPDTASPTAPLFPLHAALDLVGSLSIATSDLNLFTLTSLAGIRVLWTDNLSRHLLLSRRGPGRRYIELFALPCALHTTGSGGGPHDVLRDAAGFSSDLMDEVVLSYANLMNPCPTGGRLHSALRRILGLRAWCWCVGCSSVRLRRRELRKLKSGGGEVNSRRDKVSVPYDPLLEELATQEPVLWDRMDFENLWPRIVALDKCLQEAKPWNFWVLLRDNRDTVQYWTFLFGSIILVLTLVQVILGALQVSQAFASPGPGPP